MNDEIKEKKIKRIIEKIEGLATYVTIPRELAIYNVNIDSQEAKLLTDYITNLQEEINKLTAESTEWESKCYDLQEENKQLKKNQRLTPEQREHLHLELDEICDIYKSRIDKAIENIDLVIELIKQQPTEDDSWILNKLNGFKYLLNGSNNDSK